MMINKDRVVSDTFFVKSPGPRAAGEYHSGADPGSSTGDGTRYVRQLLYQFNNNCLLLICSPINRLRFLLTLTAAAQAQGTSMLCAQNDYFEDSVTF